MAYGSNLNADGKEIVADGRSPIMTGECVEKNVIEFFGMSLDPQSGETSQNKAEIRFRQTNGALFIQSFLASEEQWAQDKINQHMVHICSKIVPKEEYYAMMGGELTFPQFIAKVKTIIDKAIAAKTQFNLKIVLRQNKNNQKWYPQFPNFPNFIELAGTSPCTFQTNPQYDFYEIPTETSAPASSGSNSSSEDAPF